MEKLIVHGFKPSGGKHCWTTALKNIFDYHELHLSEEMLFGLGGGIGFIYWYMKLMPAPFIGTRYGKGVEPLINTCKRIGAECTIAATSSAEKGYEELKKQLREGEPAFVFVDMPYLPYLAVPEEAHFGGHTIVVFGIDEKTNKVHISDRCRKSVTVGIEELKKARSSKFPPFAPKNKLLKVKYPSKIGNLEKGIKASIRECCANMLKPPIKNIGLAGIKKWAGLVTKWPQQFEGLALFGCLFNVFLYIEIAGTGGGGFRNMYADFLGEAGSILREPALKEAAEMFSDSGRLWSETATAALPDSWPTLKKIRQLAIEKNELFERQPPHALENMQKLTLQSDELMKQAVRQLRQKDPAPLLAALQQKIMRCCETEEKAIKELNEIIK
ncbi:MAG: BtrH N-terminal domain-containing protein [Planctomycetota bacterium]|jgi:hypothetical protein